MGSGYGRKRPPRLPQVFQPYDPPLYFCTLCVARRKPVLARPNVHNAFRSHALRGQKEFGVAVGRYVIMPDHLHLFVRLPPEMRLTYWVRGMKRTIRETVHVDTGESFWQEGFFDHLLRSSESYAQKWQYVFENPVRAGLVSRAEDWPYSGEIVRIDHV